MLVDHLASQLVLVCGTLTISVNAGFCSQPPLHILAGLYLWMFNSILIIVHIVYGFLVNATFALAEFYVYVFASTRYFRTFIDN
jgi:hypothetical protein